MSLGWVPVRARLAGAQVVLAQWGSVRPMGRKGRAAESWRLWCHRGKSSCPERGEMGSWAMGRVREPLADKDSRSHSVLMAYEYTFIAQKYCKEIL